MTPELFRDVMRHHAATVVLVTTQGRNRVGLTATSFVPVSADPPLVLFCVTGTASAWPILAEADRIAVHLLGHDGQELAQRFSTSGIDRFDHPAVGSADGFTTVGGAVAWLDCRVVDRTAAGDHHIVLAAPVRGGHAGRDHGPPLLYHDRHYLQLPPQPVQKA